MIKYRNWGFQVWTFQPNITCTFNFKEPGPIFIHWLRGNFALCPPANPQISPARRAVLVCLNSPENTFLPTDASSSVPAGQACNHGVSGNYWSAILDQCDRQVHHIPLDADWSFEPIELPGNRLNLYVFPQAWGYQNGGTVPLTDQANAPDLEMQAVLMYSTSQ